MKLLRVIREFVEAPKAEKVTYHKQRAALGTMSVFASVASTIQPDREVSSFRAEGTEVAPQLYIIYSYMASPTLVMRARRTPR